MHFFAERRAGGQHTHAHKRLYITRTKLRINFVFIRGEGGGGAGVWRNCHTNSETEKRQHINGRR